MKIEDTTIPRFKLATMNKKNKYLIDLDSHKISWLIPMSTWFLANSAMKITDQQYNHLKSIKKGKAGTSLWSFSGFMIGGMIYGVFKGIEESLFNNITNGFLIGAMLSLLPIVIIFRYLRFYFNSKKLKKNYDVLNNSNFDGYIKLNKSDRKKSVYKKRCITGTVILLVVFIFLFYLYIETASMIMLPILCIYFIFISFINTSILKPFESMEYFYFEKGK
ncbi:hypothetical protein ATZ33_01295 [Enterococcus silesiacus]|uniref:Tandem five-TM protein n=1 Tax=Enterococcus silesiacus TaxID=332949 RepID=A0A0S3K762_9ENTE|nr:DUF443 family protein [Enterococcus silesiacus]ALS00066.1 hypothetical protein ATZ33_01295 [Enterococcus silesiacus]OJG91011.1 tandem five-TM protein [Enterococcus silesiacus]